MDINAIVTVSFATVVGILGMIFGHIRAARSSNFHGDYRGIGARIVGSGAGLVVGGLIGAFIGEIIMISPILIFVLCAVVVVFFILEWFNRTKNDRKWRASHNMTAKNR